MTRGRDHPLHSVGGGGLAYDRGRSASRPGVQLGIDMTTICRPKVSILFIVLELL